MVICQVFAGELMALFVKDEEVIGHGVIYLHLIAVMYILPAVTNAIQGFFRGKLQLRAQHGFLRRLRGGIPVIVQTDLADGADLWLRCQRADLIQTVVRPTGGLLRVPADGSINKIIFLRDGDGALRRHGTVARARGGDCRSTDARQRPHS